MMKRTGRVFGAVVLSAMTTVASARANDLIRRAVGNERAAPGRRAHIAFEHQLLVHLRDGIEPDAQLLRQQPRRRHLAARRQFARQDRLLQQPMQLAIDRLPVAPVETLRQPVGQNTHAHDWLLHFY